LATGIADAGRVGANATAQAANPINKSRFMYFPPWPDLLQWEESFDSPHGSMPPYAMPSTVRAAYKRDPRGATTEPTSGKSIRARPVPVLEHRVLTESSVPLEETKLALAGAAFHPE
jgi:hypothetical protein